MEIKMYLQMLKRGWWLILISMLTALVASLTYSYISVPIYMATARYVASPDASLSYAGDVINSLNTLDKRSIVMTYAAVLNSESIYAKAINDLNFAAEQLTDYKRTSVVLPESNVLEVYVEGPDPEIDMLLADSIGKQAINYIAELNQGYYLRVLDPAQLPSVPVRPQSARDASLAVLLGMVFGASLAIIREQLISPLEAFVKRSTLDEDSGVLNRKYFDQKIDETLTRSALSGSHTLGLMYLDGLSDLLVVMPKPLGQKLLHQVARILRNELRGNDLIGRWDDVTFSVLLPETPVKGASVILGRVQMVLSAPINIDDSEVIQLKPRIGLVERLENESAPVLRERAELALRQTIAGNLNLVIYNKESDRS